MAEGDLKLEPEEFVFVRPSKLKIVLKLTNKSKGKITFKVKTTAPKQYSVRPNPGIIAAGGTFDVSVDMVKANEVDIEKYQDGFLVQWMAVPEKFVESAEAIAKLWQQQKDENKKVPYTKIKCKLEEEKAAKSDPKPAIAPPAAEAKDGER